MVFIYCIEDVNGLKYIGSTKQNLNKRLTHHRCHSKCSSRELDLKNCKIYSLEECIEETRRVREQYWIDNTECVNMYNTIRDEKKYMKEYNKEYRQKNKDKLIQDKKEYYNQNKDKIKGLEIKKYQFIKSWGGDYRYHNNLLKIDPNIFL